MRIAVVGSGIAGLSCSWLLTQAGHDVTVYERAAQLGMDAEAVDISVPHLSEPVRIDMPLRVFTDSYYPHLTSLYNTVGIEYSKEDYSGSFSTLSGDSFFTYRNLIVQSLSIPYMVPAELLSLTRLRSLAELLYFLNVSPRHLRDGRLGFPSGIDRAAAAAADPSSSSSSSATTTTTTSPCITLREYVQQEGYSETFVRRLLVPMMAGICTCSHESMLEYPAALVVEYLTTRSMRGVRRVSGGTKEIVERLSQRCKVLLNTSISAIDVDEANHCVRIASASNETASYDHVVVATQANQAVRLLRAVPDDVKALLAQVKYERSSLVLHRDEALMPRHRMDWKSVNFILPDDWRTAERVHEEGMATIWMNRAQRGLGAQLGDALQLFQTWNPLVQPRAELTYARAEFERPVVTPSSLVAMQRLWPLQGRNGLWFVGSYACTGVPLLETAVTSAVRVASALGAPCEWNERVSELKQSQVERLYSPHARRGASVASSSSSSSPSSSSSSSSSLSSSSSWQSIPVAAAVCVTAAVAAVALSSSGVIGTVAALGGFGGGGTCTSIGSA